jgi:mRNA-degrading endonuclease toxin of MazEF toxin-antitoxin module
MSGVVGPLRGQIFHIDEEGVGPHYWLVVSNNRRNAHLSQVLTVMLTTTPPRSPRPSHVPLAKGQDSFEGWANCDDIGPHDRAELGPVRGALSPPTMRRVDAGLAFALGLPAPAAAGRGG